LTQFRPAALVPLALTLALALGAAAGARAAEPDWDKLAAVRDIEVITHDEDGDVRETTIWLAVLDGQGFIRTGNSSWGQNLKRNPNDVVLRIEGTEYPLHAEFIENEKLRERVTAAFHEKYGWLDSLVHLTRGSRPNIMHMISR
jgi:hypothetical protein